MDPQAANSEFQQLVRRFQPVETRAREHLEIDAKAFASFRDKFTRIIPSLSGEALAIALVMKALCILYMRLADPTRAEREMLEELAGAEAPPDLVEARDAANRGRAVMQELGMNGHIGWANDVCSRLG